MAGTIAVSPTLTFLDAAGKPASNGTLTVYDANTTTPAVTWQDRNQTIANTNPIVLNARGECVVWFEPGKLYDFLAKDSLNNTIDNSQDVSGATSAVVAPSIWMVTGLAPTFINARTFSLVGNQTADFSVGRRVKVQVTAGTRYATIISSVFSTITTVTLGFQNSIDALDSGLSAVDLGLDNPMTPAIGIGLGSVIDMTGYGGADISLGIGQIALYSMAAATSLLLRVATGDNESYEIDVANSAISTAVAGANTATLAPNNAPIATNDIKNHYAYWSSSALPPPVLGLNNVFVTSGGNLLMNQRLCVSTKTTSKRVSGEFTTQDPGNWYKGFVDSHWLDATTLWSSLGTLGFQNAITGIVKVKRLY